MADDWRVTVELEDAAHTDRLRHALAEEEVEEEVRHRLGGRIAVGERDGAVLLYAGTSAGAHEAADVVRELLRTHGLDADLSIDRWHPLEERWEDERVPLPTTAAERETEHERMEEDEIAESDELGAGLWEVRIELDSREEAETLAERLESESDTLLAGWTCSVVRRWRYVLIGADTEDQANEIAERVRDELPPGAVLHVEPSGALFWRAFRHRPFALFVS